MGAESIRRNSAEELLVRCEVSHHYAPRTASCATRRPAADRAVFRGIGAELVRICLPSSGDFIILREDC